MKNYAYHFTKQGTYDPVTGQLKAPNSDITCTDARRYCSTAFWTNTTWHGGNVPNLNPDPPLKDTVVVPTGKV